MDGLDLSADVPVNVGLKDVIPRESVRNAKLASLVRSVIKDVPLIVQKYPATENMATVRAVSRAGPDRSVSALDTVILMHVVLIKDVCPANPVGMDRIAGLLALRTVIRADAVETGDFARVVKTDFMVVSACALGFAIPLVATRKVLVVYVLMDITVLSV